METFALVVLLALVLVVLHVVVAAYLYRATLPADDGPAGDDPAADERAAPPDDRGPENVGETTACPICGAPNDPSYRFCRRCVGDLSGQRATTDGVAAGRLGS